MVDDAATTPPIESTPTPEAAPEPQAAEPAAAGSTPALTTPPPVVVESSATPVVSAEAVNKIGDVIADAVQESLAPKVDAPEPSDVRPREIATTPTPPDPSPTANRPPPPVATSTPPHQSAGARMRAGVQAKKHARLEKIVSLAVEKRVITNDDVQKLLLVSDSTATRYLKELVKTGRLKLSGSKKKHETYEPL